MPTLPYLTYLLTYLIEQKNSNIDREIRSEVLVLVLVYSFRSAEGSLVYLDLAYRKIQTLYPDNLSYKAEKALGGTYLPLKALSLKRIQPATLSKVDLSMKRILTSYIHSSLLFSSLPMN